MLFDDTPQKPDVQTATTSGETVPMDQSMGPPAVPVKMPAEPDITLELNKAKQLYWVNKYAESLVICQNLLKRQPDNQKILSTHICCLVELRKSSDLFTLGHELVDNHPDSALSWYCVGCYYYTIGQFDCAKRYLNKSAGMIPAFAPAWLAYGHAFAAEREHDQAMNCYLKAAKVLPNSHLPQLYVGLEYSLTNNLRLGEKFLMETLTMNDKDPYIFHELGVLSFRQKAYELAYGKMLDALNYVVTNNESDGSFTSKIQYLTMPVWEPLVNNLGIVARKMGRHDVALMCHRKALSLCPGTASTYTALALVHLEMGDFNTAIEMLHRSLAIKNDDNLVRTLLTKTLEAYDKDTSLWGLGDSTDYWINVEIPPSLNVKSKKSNNSTTTSEPKDKLDDTTNILKLM